MLKSKYLESDEAFDQRGQEIFDSEVVQTLTTEDVGKTVAIDVINGCFVIDWHDYTAMRALLAMNEDCLIWTMVIKATDLQANHSVTAAEEHS